MSSIWTDEMVDRLRALAAAPDASRSQIAQTLAREFPAAAGLSRDAVLGKLHRLGVSAEPVMKRAAVAKVRRAAPKPRAMPRPPGPPAGAPATPEFDRHAARKDCFENPDGRGVRLIDIRDGQCRWPLGDARDYETFRFCGEPTQTRIVWVTKTKPVETSASFCCEHYALSTSRDPAHRALMRASSPSVRRCDASVVEASK